MQLKHFLFLFLSSFAIKSIAQINLIHTGTDNVLNIPSVLGKNILVNGNHDYLVKSYNECDDLLPLTIPGTPGNNKFYQRVDSTLLFAFVADFNSYDFKIFKSLDDGQSWLKIFDSIGGVIFTHFAFFDQNEGLLFSSFQKMARTKDGGKTWLPETIPTIWAQSVEVFGDSTLCIGTIDSGVGAFMTSNSRGKTWINAKGDALGKSSGPTSTFFLNKDTIFGVGTVGWDGVPFTKSCDGGNTWKTSTITTIGTIRPFGICAKSKNEIYAIGVSSGTIGIILKSTDIGETWSLFSTGIKTELTDMIFLNDSIALVSGSNGVLFKWNSRQAVFSPITAIDKNEVTAFRISVYPNPIRDCFYFKMDLPINNKLNLKMVNSLGQTVYVVNEVLPQEKIDVSFLSPGVYYVEVKSELSQQIFKLLKE